MRGVQADDPRAFETLYDRHAALALRLARAVCPDPGRAEDAVQEAFVSFWRSRASYHRATGSVQSWLIAIVRNRAVDTVRRESATHPPRLADADCVVRDPASGSTQDEVIALAYYGELTYREIAQMLSLPSGTVKGRMRLGLDKLREQITAATEGSRQATPVPRLAPDPNAPGAVRSSGSS